MLVLKIIGRSPLDVTILYSFVVALMIHGFYTSKKLGQFEEFSRNTKDSFKLVREDMKEIKERLIRIEDKLEKKLK